MIYFTAPTFRESYGRVLAEAVAAGKIAISDPETASAFGGAVQAATPQEVNGMIQSYIADPDKYRSHIRAAQRALEQFSPSAFAARFNAVFGAFRWDRRKLPARGRAKIPEVRGRPLPV